MATYATFAEMTQRYGTAALTALIPADATDSLATLAGQALVEAAGEIDSVLGGSGYTTPVDTSTITDSDQQARAAALLRRLEIGLAVFALSRGEVGADIKSESSARGSVTYGQMAGDVSWARKYLGLVASRKVSIPGITQPGRTFVRHMGASVPDADDVAARISMAGGW